MGKASAEHWLQTATSDGKHLKKKRDRIDRISRIDRIDRIDHVRPTSKKKDPTKCSYECNFQSDPSMYLYNLIGTPSYNHEWYQHVLHVSAFTHLG